MTIGRRAFYVSFRSYRIEGAKLPNANAQ